MLVGFMMMFILMYVWVVMKRMLFVVGIGLWKVGINWVQDVWVMLFGSVKDGMKYFFGVKDKVI